MTSEREQNPEMAVMFPIDDVDLSLLRTRLVTSADRKGLIEVAYRSIDTALGPLLLVATERGLVRIAFEREGFDAVLETCASRISPRVMEVPNRLDTAANQLDEYLAGVRRNFDLALDHSLSTGFRQTVQAYLPNIAYGSTSSYKEVAASVGKPRAVRATGSACATNPLPLVVPCHRVLRSDGSLGGYVGGNDAKATLLALEQEHS